MTVVLRHNEQLELNRVEYHGAVSLGELIALAEFQAANPTWLTYDALSLVLPSADFSGIDKAALDTLFAKYKQLFEPLHFLILRRSAWICQSDLAQAHVQHWLSGRDTREDVSSDVRKFDTFAEAGDWLILSPCETVALESGEGFTEIVSCTSPAARPLAR